MDNETAAFESAQPETEEEWEYGSESRGRILWGRIIALAIALVVAFLAGRATAGRGGISKAEYDRVKGDLAAARAEIANQNVGGPKVTGTPTSSPSPSLTPSPAGTAGRSYVVRNGDTLRGLALKFYGDASLVDLIAQANHITDPTRVYEGMKLIIPPKP